MFRISTVLNIFEKQHEFIGNPTTKVYIQLIITANPEVMISNLFKNIFQTHLLTVIGNFFHKWGKLTLISYFFFFIIFSMPRVLSQR